MSIRNRINRFIKKRKKELQAKRDRRMRNRDPGITAAGEPRMYRNRAHKMRGCDGTMYGPYRSRQGG